MSLRGLGRSVRAPTVGLGNGRLLGRPNRLHDGSHQPADDRQCDHAGGTHRAAMPTNKLGRSIGNGVRAGEHRLVVQVPGKIQRQTIGRLITPGALFFQALHHDPVEIAIQRMNQPGGFGLTIPGNRGELIGPQRTQTR